MSELLTEEQWLEKFKQTQKKSDLSDRMNETKEEREARISSDPAPQWRAEAPKPYQPVFKHYILCVDEEKANFSLPEAETLHMQPHELGAVLVSDRPFIPEGWIKMPARGTPIETIEKTYPAVYEIYKMREQGTF